MSLHLSNDFIVHSIPLLARANCDVEEDPHVTLGQLGGSEKIEPILVFLNNNDFGAEWCNTTLCIA